MKYAIIDAVGQVVNTVEVEPEVLLPTTTTNDAGETVNVPASWSPPDGCTIQQSDVAGIGWTFTNGVFVAPPVPVVETPVIAPPTLSELQAQLAAIAAQINAMAKDA